MNRSDTDELRPYLERLHELPFVASASLGGRDDRLPVLDSTLTLRTAPDQRVFKLRLRHQPSRRLNEVLLSAVLAQRDQAPAAEWILFAPHVTVPMATRLAARRMNFVDLAGNCRLVLGRNRVALIEGRQPTRAEEDARVVGPTGYRLIFTLLADPTSRGLPIRELALRAGVGKSLAAVTLVRLEAAGLIARVHGGAVVLKPRELFQRWLIGYLELVRPHSVLGRYDSVETDPSKLEEQIEAKFTGFSRASQVAERATPFASDTEQHLAWGGVSAAWRLIRHYRGASSVLHAASLPADFATRLRLLPSRTGNLIVLASLGPTGFSKVDPSLAHPLLVYAELLATGDERAAETAEMLRARFLTEWA